MVFILNQEVDENCELMDTLEKNVEEAKSDVKSANEVVQELRAENESCNLKFVLFFNGVKNKSEKSVIGF